MVPRDKQGNIGQIAGSFPPTMTKDDVHREIGRAYVERRDLLQEIACLRARLQNIGQALSALAENPLHKKSVEAIESATDPREDWRELKKSHAQLSNLEKILK